VQVVTLAHLAESVRLEVILHSLPLPLRSVVVEAAHSVRKRRLLVVPEAVREVQLEERRQVLPVKVSQVDQTLH
jgi:hypothetical protein